jgi:hypothetical protein
MSMDERQRRASIEQEFEIHENLLALSPSS